MAHALPEGPANRASSRLTPCQDDRSIAQNSGKSKHFRAFMPRFVCRRLCSKDVETRVVRMSQVVS